MAIGGGAAAGSVGTRVGSATVEGCAGGMAGARSGSTTTGRVGGGANGARVLVSVTTVLSGVRGGGGNFHNTKKPKSVRATTPNKKSRMLIPSHQPIILASGSQLNFFSLLRETHRSGWGL